MNTRPIDEACDPDLRGSLPALKRAAKRAREIAAQTGTAVVVNRNGKIVHVSPQGAASVAHAQEPETPYDDQG